MANIKTIKSTPCPICKKYELVRSYTGSQFNPQMRCRNCNKHWKGDGALKLSNLIEKNRYKATFWNRMAKTKKTNKELKGRLAQLKNILDGKFDRKKS